MKSFESMKDMVHLGELTSCSMLKIDNNDFDLIQVLKMLPHIWANYGTIFGLSQQYCALIKHHKRLKSLGSGGELRGTGGDWWGEGGLWGCNQFQREEAWRQPFGCEPDLVLLIVLHINTISFFAIVAFDGFILYMSEYLQLVPKRGYVVG